MMNMMKPTKPTAPALLFALSLAIVLAATAQGKEDWVVLGDRAVSARVDLDILPVTAARGDFKSIKIKVFGRAVTFHQVTIHFANGETQAVELRHTIPAGGESRVIDIDGHDRVIQSIEFRYDAKSLRGKLARVRVLARS